MGSYENVPLENISLIEVLGSADSVSALIDFADPTPHAMLTFRDRSVFVSCVSTCISPLAYHSSTRCTRVEPGLAMPDPPLEYQGGTLRTEGMVAFESNSETGTSGAGPWYDKLHYFLDNDRDAPMCVRSLQTEYFVRMDELDSAIEAIRPVAAKWPGWRTWDNKNPETQVPPPFPMRRCLLPLLTGLESSGTVSHCRNQINSG